MLKKYMNIIYILGYVLLLIQVNNSQAISGSQLVINALDAYQRGDCQGFMNQFTANATFTNGDIQVPMTMWNQICESGFNFTFLVREYSDLHYYSYLYGYTVDQYPTKELQACGAMVFEHFMIVLDETKSKIQEWKDMSDLVYYNDQVQFCKNATHHPSIDIIRSSHKTKSNNKLKSSNNVALDFLNYLLYGKCDQLAKLLDPNFYYEQPFGSGQRIPREQFLSGCGLSSTQFEMFHNEQIITQPDGLMLLPGQAALNVIDPTNQKPCTVFFQESFLFNISGEVVHSTSCLVDMNDVQKQLSTKCHQS